MSQSVSFGQNLKEWIFTTDHKRIGILYLIGSLAAFAVAGAMAMLIRIELSSIGPTITNPNTYNVWLYFHGAAMILGSGKHGVWSGGTWRRSRTRRYCWRLESPVE